MSRYKSGVELRQGLIPCGYLGASMTTLLFVVCVSLHTCVVKVVVSTKVSTVQFDAFMDYNITISDSVVKMLF